MTTGPTRDEVVLAPNNGVAQIAFGKLWDVVNESVGMTGGIGAPQTGVRAPDGTVAAPGIAFQADPDTGWFRTGPNSMAAVVGGSIVFELHSDGSLTIPGEINGEDRSAVRYRTDYAALLADTDLTYTAGQAHTVAAGVFIVALDELQIYRVAASDAVDHRFATAGGVKLYESYRGHTSQTQDPVGRGGVRVVIGDTLDANYAYGGFVDTGSGKWVYIYRRASTHAINNNGAVWQADSYDRGRTLINHRKLQDYAGVSDARPGTPRILANGRIGFLVNRIAEDGTDYDPVIFLSDDAGDTWTKQTLVRPVGAGSYSFAAHGGIVDFPTSQGGNDAEGFIAFGFISAGGYGYLYTLDNFTNYNWGATTVAEPAGAVTGLSECIQIYIGSGRWLAYARNKDVAGWRDDAACWKITNLTDWGAIQSGGFSLGGNPPSGFWDEPTNRVHLFVPSRGGRWVDDQRYDNWVMHISADADELWAANGDFSALAGGAVDLKPFMPMPYWGVWYADWKNIGPHWWATFTCGEDGEAGSPGTHAVIAQIGDFVPTGVEQTVWNFMFTRRIFGRSLQLRAASNATDDYPAKVMNRSGTATGQMGAYGLSFSATAEMSAGGAWTVTVGGGISVTAGGHFSMDLGGNAMLLGGLAAPYGSGGQLHIPVLGAALGALVTEAGTADQRTHGYIRNPNGVVGSYGSDGAGAFFSTTSDARLKTNRVPLEAEMDIDAIIEGLRPTAFDWQDASGNLTGVRSCGLIAQEVAAVYPIAVSPGRGAPGDGDFQPAQVELSRLVVPVLTKVRAMDKEVRSIKAQLDALNRK